MKDSYNSWQTMMKTYFSIIWGKNQNLLNQVKDKVKLKVEAKSYIVNKKDIKVLTVL